MTAPTPHSSEAWVCVRCTGVNGLHYLTCPTLQLREDWMLTGDEENAQ